MMNGYLEALKKYATFSGRAQRSEYWYFVLFNVIISLVAGAIDAMIGEANIISTIYMLAVLIPSLAVTVRRLHDTDRSGWWTLISLVPLVGFIVLIVFCAQDSDAGTNRFGPNPKAAGLAAQRA